MYRKTVTRLIPKNAQPSADGKIKIQINGRWVEREVNSAGRMVEYSKRWYGKVTYSDGTSKELALTTEKASSTQKLASAQLQAFRIANGLEDAPRPEADRLLTDLAEEWLNDLQARGRAATYISTARARIFRLLKECTFLNVPLDLTKLDAGKNINLAVKRMRTGTPISLPPGDYFTPMQLRIILGLTDSGLVKLVASRGVLGTGNGKARKFSREESETLIGHRGEGWSPATVNAYRACLTAFSNWLKRQGIIDQVPTLALWENERNGQRKIRRAITWADCEHLAKITKESGLTKAGMSPESRALLYKVAFRTLLRARALRELTVGDCHLSDPLPFISVRAETDKTGRPRAIPLPANLAQELNDYLKAKTTKVRVWQIPQAIAKVMRSDLKRAGIPFATAEGECDFHALRHSGATHMARSSVGLDVIAKIGGWSNLQMFFNRYGHYSLDDLTNSAAKAWS